MKIPRAISCDWAVPFEGCGGSFFFQPPLFLSYFLFFSLPFLPSAIFFSPLPLLSLSCLFSLAFSPEPRIGRGRLGGFLVGCVF